ncbi:hypothetical protein NDU88_003656 [Pleurodeles waltl]|uniref:Uncharacterized protein n=1 Tax=Pleurodeles waltl TaxID=8319 RepID=A0AAV7QAA1_PLEWA|nr:hypothetical protein NDU88_003656 [Pleurodeles waltl]
MLLAVPLGHQWAVPLDVSPLQLEPQEKDDQLTWRSQEPWTVEIPAGWAGEESSWSQEDLKIELRVRWSPEPGGSPCHAELLVLETRGLQGR